MYEAYRVLKQFQWRGWIYAPNPGGACECDCLAFKGDPDDPVQAFPDCKGKVASLCLCRETVCRCSCGIPDTRYAGDIWIVEAGHDRKDMQLGQRKVVGDASIPSVEDLLAQDEYAAQLVPWAPGSEAFWERRRVAARKSARARTDDEGADSGETEPVAEPEKVTA